MEIIIRNLSYKNLKNLNFTINDHKIVGITGIGKTTILKLLKGVLNGRGTIKYNGEKYTSKNKYEIIKQIGYIDSSFDNPFSVTTIEEYMYFYIQYYKLNIKDPKKKVEDSLRIVGLNNRYLTRNVLSLSSSEKKLLQLARVLLLNPKIILFDEPFLDLDNKNEKKLARLFNQLNDRFGINIVIASNDADKLYMYTNKIILVKDNTILLEDDTKIVYEDVEFLKKNGFEIPSIVMFTYIAKTKKNVNIDYHRDIRDLIKDIYKHV